jgi:cytochrome P450
LFAGSESTANVLSETLYELALNPCIQDRLRAELNSVAGDQSADQPTFDQLMRADQLPYLDAVMRESMRLKAVLMEISRTVSIVALSRRRFLTTLSIDESRR